MEFQNGTAYESNYARAAAGFLATCAPAPAEAPRLAAYQMITGIYEAAFRDASQLGWKPLPDAPFAPWEQQRGREKDVKSIRDAMAKLEALIKALFDAVEAGEATEDELLLRADAPALPRALIKALALCGYTPEAGPQPRIPMPRGCAEALKTLCAVSRAHTVPITDGPQEDKAYLFFSRCVFDPEENWAAAAFDRLMQADGRLLALCEALEQRGYARIVCRDGKKVSLDYVKQRGKKTEPVKMSWADKTHAGIEVSFEELRLEPCFLWLRMPLYKTVLEQADALPASVRTFLADWTKTCDGCRYCVQTDKTHTRPLAAVQIDGKNKCPLYPSFSMNWRSLSPELYENILASLDATEALLQA